MFGWVIYMRAFLGRKLLKCERIIIDSYIGNRKYKLIDIYFDIYFTCSRPIMMSSTLKKWYRMEEKL